MVSVSVIIYPICIIIKLYDDGVSVMATWSDFKSSFIRKISYGFGKNVYPTDASAPKIINNQIPPLTPLAIITNSFIALPSTQHIKGKQNITRTGEPTWQELGKSIVAQSNGYTGAQWASGFIILPLLNLAQIALTSALELVVRTAAAGLLQKVFGLYDYLKYQPSEDDNFIIGTLKSFFNGSVMLVISPAWSIGQTLSLVADTLSNTRQLLDSAIHIANPIWWMSKFANMFGADIKTPSLVTTTTSLLASALKLVPAGLTIAAGIFSAGLLLPATHALAGPLGATGSYIVATYLTPIAALGSTAAAIYAGGAVSAISKTLGAFVNTVNETFSAWLEPKVNRVEQKIIGLRKDTPNANIHGGTVATIARTANFKNGAALSPPSAPTPEAPVRIDTANNNANSPALTVTPTHKNVEEPTRKRAPSLTK